MNRLTISECVERIEIFKSNMGQSDYNTSKLILMRTGCLYRRALQDIGITPDEKLFVEQLIEREPVDLWRI
ncbi:MAG: hypothetical protein P4N59_15925 [Negativicutes bacterium]|nr:hypothetical protein [Negativicutes bacterium]